MGPGYKNSVFRQGTAVKLVELGAEDLSLCAETRTIAQKVRSRLFAPTVFTFCTSAHSDEEGVQTLANTTPSHRLRNEIYRPPVVVSRVEGRALDGDSVNKGAGLCLLQTSPKEARAQRLVCQPGNVGQHK